jgi:cytochrome b6-f complex iron-sulfur subunit
MEDRQAPLVGSESAPRVASREHAGAKALAAQAASEQGPQQRPTAKDQPGAESNRLTLRRRFVWTAMAAFLTTNFLMFLRFFFPRTLFEPSSRFRIGYPSDFGLGIDERFKQSHRIWVVRLPDRMFVVFAKCTHLGCTPNWIEADNKFKCPCHGSGYDMEGRNFEGPAPRPMDRAHVELDAEGQIVVDTSRLYQCPPGGKCDFDTDPNSYLVAS